MTDISDIRILLADVAETLLSDAQITALLALEPNVYRAAAMGARAIAAQFAQKTRLTVGPTSIANNQKFEHYMELAKAYEARAKDGGTSDSGNGYLPRMTGISESEMATQRADEDRTESQFPKGWDWLVNQEPEGHYEESSS